MVAGSPQPGARFDSANNPEKQSDRPRLLPLRGEGGSDAAHARSHEKQPPAASRTTHLQWNESVRLRDASDRPR